MHLRMMLSILALVSVLILYFIVDHTGSTGSDCTGPVQFKSGRHRLGDRICATARRLMLMTALNTGLQTE